MKKDKDSYHVGKLEKRLKKRWFVFIALFSIFAITQYFNHTGLCYSEMRYLDKVEMVDRFLFGDDYKNMSFEEKVEAAKRRGYPTGVGEIKYPECCRVSHDLNWPDSFTKTLNSMLGSRIFLLVSYFPVEPYTSSRHPYMEFNNYIGPCGERFKGFSPSMDVSESSYENELRINKEVWTKQGVLNEYE